MDPLVAAALIAALVLIATAAGVATRVTSGRKRRVAVGDVTADDVGVHALAPVATVVQFSTEFCSRCPGVKRVLTGAFSDERGIVYTDVDLTHRPDLASRLRVLQTPTVLVVDALGRVVSRYAGTVPVESVRADIAELRKADDVALV
ncbi:thioredoxin family protein [Microbacterium sp. C7(2022)]|uniref:thioredoxin family protein n=1 Tax=Microbacterium sp. C7(2022) TaxID=2992759 RepID=UPI00237B2C83|nr:thioredoxin family protein [Microbacterium sp. C7(2022)]MDE0546513.1 thioredoxin family protein [Microbacterium sp. C7(2022)]